MCQLTHYVNSHGRDNKLLVWQLGTADEATLDNTLPVDADATLTRQPWLLYGITVNALNFCSFAMCCDGMPQVLSTMKAIKDSKTPDPILIAVPSTFDSDGVCSAYVAAFLSKAHEICRLTYSNSHLNIVPPKSTRTDSSPLVR